MLPPFAYYLLFLFINYYYYTFIKWRLATVPCPQFTDCAACTQPGNTHCAWCDPSLKCLPIANPPPKPGDADCPNNWFYGECPGTLTEPHTHTHTHTHTLVGERVNDEQMLLVRFIYVIEHNTSLYSDGLETESAVALAAVRHRPPTHSLDLPLSLSLAAAPVDCGMYRSCTDCTDFNSHCFWCSESGLSFCSSYSRGGTTTPRYLLCVCGDVCYSVCAVACAEPKNWRRCCVHA